MYYSMRIVAAFLSLWPAALLEKIAAGAAILFFDVFRLRRTLVLQNLDHAFQDSMTASEKQAIGRASYKHFLLTAFEFLRSRSHDIASDFEMVGEEHLRAAIAKGEGVYILCMHMGSWEAMGAFMTRTFGPTHVLVKKVGGSGMSRFVEELRAHNQFLCVQRSKKGDGMRAIATALQAGELVGFVMDQARPGEPRLPFFGQPAKTNTSFAAIWQKMPAPIVKGFIRRRGLGRHVLTFYPELELPITADPAQQILDHSLLFNREVEQVVRQCPEQYFWLHNRWK